MQTIREQEKNALYNEYHSKEKELITGIVQRVADNGDLTIDLGRLQTVLKADDKFKDKKFAPGDRIKLYVVDVINREKGGPVVRVSRKSQELVKKLFDRNCPCSRNEQPKTPRRYERICPIVYVYRNKCMLT